MEKRQHIERKYYTINEVARICRVARGSIDRWHRECPDFPRKIILGAGCVRFEAVEIHTWLDSCSAQRQ